MPPSLRHRIGYQEWSTEKFGVVEWGQQYRDCSDL